MITIQINSTDPLQLAIESRYRIGMQSIDHIRPSDVAGRLATVGYVARRREALALAGLMRAPDGAGARALLLEGPPGVGKSALAEAVAKAWNADLVVGQFHAWTDSDELFVGVDVAAAVAGDAAMVRQDGVLARAARMAAVATPAEGRSCGFAVLLLDELDKAPERAENLLLDWLQSGRVPLAPGKQLRTDLHRLLIFITSNGQRTLSDALLRRVRRVAIEPLPVAQVEAILAQRTGCTPGVARIAWKLAKELPPLDGQTLSLQEGVRLIEELRLCESPDDCRESLAGWAARGDAGRAAALKTNVSALWSELTVWRRK